MSYNCRWVVRGVSGRMRRRLVALQIAGQLVDYRTETARAGERAAGPGSIEAVHCCTASDYCLTGPPTPLRPALLSAATQLALSINNRARACVLSGLPHA